MRNTKKRILLKIRNWIKSHSPPFRNVRNMARMMSGIWPVETVHIPDIKNRCQGYGQFFLALFRTSIFDVRDIDSFYWPYSRHQFLMSGIWTVFTGHIPDIKFLLKFMSGQRTVMSGTWTDTFSPYYRHQCLYPGHQ